MADIPSNDVLHDMKEIAKNMHHEGSNYYEANSPTDSNDKSQEDIEKTAPNGADWQLSHLPVDERGEYVVTMKTWAVVVVSFMHMRFLKSLC
jgi:hypothetical protein